jgi:hypothetical protein
MDPVTGLHFFIYGNIIGILTTYLTIYFTMNFFNRSLTMYGNGIFIINNAGSVKLFCGKKRSIPRVIYIKKYVKVSEPSIFPPLSNEDIKNLNNDFLKKSDDVLLTPDNEEEIINTLKDINENCFSNSRS